MGVRLVGPIIKGIQSQGIIANAKHYVNNEIEDHRQTVSANVDERTRFELYYPVFQAAVDAGVLSVMCAYNRINDVHACENPDTLGHLKNTMGYQGYIMSDWMATHSTTDSLHAGLDQEMPLGLFYSNAALTKELSSNKINITQIDESVTRILTSMYAIGMFEPDYYDGTESPTAHVSTPENIALAREIVAKSTVLLRNQGGVLPLTIGTTVTKIAVIGDNSTVSGGGSGNVSPAYISTHADGVRSALATLGRSDIEVIYHDGIDVTGAVSLANEADIVLVVVATTCSEGSDRDTLSLGMLCVFIYIYVCVFIYMCMYMCIC